MHAPQPHCKVVPPSPNHTQTRSYICIYYYTPLPLNLANKQQASNKQQAFLLSVFAIAPPGLIKLYSTLAILEPRWCPC